MMAFIVTVVLLFLIAVFIRLLAELGILWVFVPANMYALVTTKANKTTDITKGGGSVVDVIHNVPGKILDKSDPDSMKWKFVDGKESRGILFTLLGVQWIGIFRSLRLNIIRSFRYGRANNEKEFSISPKDLETKFVFYSSEHAVEVKSAETAGNFSLDLIYNLIYENIYPVMAILKVADSNSVLTQLASAKTISVTGAYPPEDFLGGNEANKKMLSDAILSITTDAQNQIGVSVSAVNLFSIDVDTGTRTLLELEETTKRQNAAAIAIAEKEKKVAILTAEGRKQAGILANDAAEDHVKRVILPIANNPGAVTVRGHEAYENNDTVTVFAPGANGTSLMIPSPVAPTRPTPPAPITGTP